MSHANTFSSASISSSSRIGGADRSAVAVDDPSAVEVVRRELDPDPVAGEDPNSKAPHLAGHMAEHDTIHVVELHAKHCVGQGLDDLAFQLDFLFLGHLDDEATSPSVLARSCPSGLTATAMAVSTPAAVSVAASVACRRLRRLGEQRRVVLRVAGWAEAGAARAGAGLAAA